MLLAKRLTNENPIIFHSNKERIISITTISLESAEEKFPIDIFCENKRKKEKYKICSLKKGFQETYSTSITLDLHNFKDKYEFTLNTKCKKASVNIIGFFEEGQVWRLYSYIFQKWPFSFASWYIILYVGVHYTHTERRHLCRTRFTLNGFRNTKQKVLR